MCGVAGYLGPRRLEPEPLQACLELMKRRGPDNQAWRSWQNPAGRQVYLLHSRLNIIDPEPRSHQPMAKGDKWISYNGELYNYLELRRELEELGRRFETASDTEVLLAALGQWGWEALDRCEGMWALACYDQGRGTLTLSRDRFGEKPLYLLRRGHELYFGSEVKFIHALLGRRLPVNCRHIYRFLVNGYKALYKTDQQFFQDLEEVPPAHCLHFSPEGRMVRECYWPWRPDRPREEMSFPEAVAETRRLLVRSVELRLRADVPLAFCLSGGVDSNALAGIATRVLGRRVHGFTIMNRDARYQEAEEVAAAVSGLGMEHTPVYLSTRGFREGLRRLVRQHDAPVYTITYYLHWQLMEHMSRRGYRVSISGTGADELFTGYYDHHNLYLAQVHGTPHWEQALRWWRDTVRPQVRNPHLRDPLLYVRDPWFRDHIFLDNRRFADYLQADWWEDFREESYSPQLLANRRLNELFHESVPVILHEEDLNAMYYSLENRSPFLDRRLCEFCFSIPARHLVQEGYAKAVLRRALRGIVPSRILQNRRKVGFNAPVLDLLNLDDPKTRAWVLEDSPIFEHVRRSLVERLLQERNLPNSRSKFLFSFLGAKLFLEEQAGL